MSTARGLQTIWVALLMGLLTAALAAAQNIGVQPSYVDETELSDEGPVLDKLGQLTRALRLRPGPSADGVVTVPVWSDDETKDRPDMQQAWELVELLQENNTTRVSFVRSADRPVTFVAWMWNVHPSNVFAVMNWKRWDPPPRTGTDITRWGMPASPGDPRPTICHWSALLRQDQPPLDIVLVDAERKSKAIGCFAAGLLKHVGNPLWAYTVRKYGSVANDIVLVEVRRLFQCALRTQYEFVRDHHVEVTTPSSVEKFMAEFEERLRRECPLGEM